MLDPLVVSVDSSTIFPTSLSVKISSGSRWIDRWAHLKRRILLSGWFDGEVSWVGGKSLTCWCGSSQHGEGGHASEEHRDVAVV